MPPDRIQTAEETEAIQDDAGTANSFEYLNDDEHASNGTSRIQLHESTMRIFLFQTIANLLVNVPVDHA